MDEKITEYIDLIHTNNILVESAANKYGTFCLRPEDEVYIQGMIDSGYTESPSVLAAYGGIKIFSDSAYSSMIEDFKKSEEASSLSDEQFDFLMMFGFSSGLLTEYRRRKSNEAYYTAFHDKEEAEYFGSRNKAGEHMYEEKYFSIPDSHIEMINTITEYQKSQANKVSK